MAKQFALINLGPLPADKINKALGHELADADVVFSAGAQKHVVARHPEDYRQYLQYAGDVVTDPTYVGDDIKNDGKIEVIRRIPVRGNVSLLIAIVVSIGSDGFYHVASMYEISQRDIDKRRQAGILKTVIHI